MLTFKQCCCQGPEVRGQGQGLQVRGQGQGQGLEQREDHQCLECKFTTHKYLSFINISDLDRTPFTGRLQINQ